MDARAADTKMSQTQETEFKDLVRTRYGGDFELAAQEILKNEDEPVITGYVNSMDRPEKRRMFAHYKRYMNDNYPGGFRTALLEGAVAPKLRVTVDSVKRMEHNPFAPKLRKALIGWGGAIVISILAGCFLPPSWAGGIIAIAGLGITSEAVDIGFDLSYYFKFRKLKKTYKSQEYIEKLNSLDPEEWARLKGLTRLVARSSDSRF